MLISARERTVRHKNFGYNFPRTALQNAASIAGLLLTTESVVVERPEPKSAGGPAGGGGMGGGMGDMY